MTAFELCTLSRLPSITYFACAATSPYKNKDLTPEPYLPVYYYPLFQTLDRHQGLVWMVPMTDVVSNREAMLLFDGPSRITSIKAIAL